MEKPRNASERFALSTFTAARRAEEKISLVFHGNSFVIPQTARYREAETRYRKVTRETISLKRRPDRHSPGGRSDQNARCHQQAQRWCSHGRGRHSCPAKISFHAGER